MPYEGCATTSLHLRNSQIEFSAGSFPGRRPMSHRGKPCYGRMGVPIFLARSVWDSIGLGIARLLMSGMGQSRARMGTHRTVTNGIAMRADGIHPGEGHAGGWL
jgi:hypothetical protein